MIPAVRREQRMVYVVGNKGTACAEFLNETAAYSRAAEIVMEQKGTPYTWGGWHYPRLRNRLARWLQWRDRRIREIAEAAERNRCNLHADCAEAEREAAVAGKPGRYGPGTRRLNHCCAEDCEDCFGK